MSDGDSLIISAHFYNAAMKCYCVAEWDLRVGEEGCSSPAQTKETCSEQCGQYQCSWRYHSLIKRKKEKENNPGKLKKRINHVLLPCSATRKGRIQNSAPQKLFHINSNVCVNFLYVSRRGGRAICTGREIDWAICSEPARRAIFFPQSLIQMIPRDKFARSLQWRGARRAPELK